MKAITEGASNTLQVIEACKKFAQSSIILQSDSMRSWGLLINWDRPIHTMDPAYECEQLLVLAKFMESGLLRRGMRPVHWSPSSCTALSDAEIEWRDDHISTACYVKFPLNGISDFSLLVWTTTPWTLFANQAISFNPTIQYCIVQIGDENFIIAKDRIESLSIHFNSIKFIRQIDLLALSTTHYYSIPFNYALDDQDNLNFQYSDAIETKENSKKCRSLLPADFVNVNEGTGLVHIAPAYGNDDFDLWNNKYGPSKPIIQCVDERGIFNIMAPVKIRQKSIFSDEVLDLIGPSLVKSYPFKHRYPYDWRTKMPIIQRITPQWFIDLDLIRSKVLKFTNEITFTPPSGRNLLSRLIESRKDWCISRQRFWGTPIPVFYKKNDPSQYIMDSKSIEHVAFLFKQYGSRIWWEYPVEKLLPSTVPSSEASQYIKGTDTLDIWFDSGCSWASSIISDELNGDLVGQKKVADLVVEGVDQFRGWFQSSLISSVIGQCTGNTKEIMSHGFIKDSDGRKMSKSIGNVVKPNEVIEKWGLDVLRLWAANSITKEGDISIGDEQLKVFNRDYDKIRNTFKFLLGNLSDFESQTVRLTRPIDQWIVNEATGLLTRVWHLYDAYNFGKGFNEIMTFINRSLSANYIEIVKARLYLTEKSSIDRVSAQSALFLVTMVILRLLSPMAPLLCAEVINHSNGLFDSIWEIKDNIKSIGNHFGGDGADESFMESTVRVNSRPALKEANEMLNIRNVLIDNGLLKKVKSTFSLMLSYEHETLVSSEWCRNFCEILSIAEVKHSNDISSSDEKNIIFECNVQKDENCGDLFRLISLPESRKCPRCWVYTKEPDGELCDSCTQIMQKYSFNLT